MALAMYVCIQIPFLVRGVHGQASTPGVTILKVEFADTVFEG